MNFPILIPPLVSYHNCIQREPNGRMYRNKKKKGKKKERSRNFSLFSCPLQCSAFLFNKTVLRNPKQKAVVFFWSRIRESNPPSRLGKPLYYRYTNPAYSTDRGNYSRPESKIQPQFVDGSEIIFKTTVSS